MICKSLTIREAAKQKQNRKKGEKREKRKNGKRREMGKYLQFCKKEILIQQPGGPREPRE